jgi:glycine betaine/proline transport system permease protein
VQPILDLMQTMPALIYLIPAIALVGTGTFPGVIGTRILGVPPVVRLATLGLVQVAAGVNEAARAVGATTAVVVRG